MRRYLVQVELISFRSRGADCRVSGEVSQPFNNKEREMMILGEIYGMRFSIRKYVIDKFRTKLKWASEMIMRGLLM